MGLVLPSQSNDMKAPWASKHDIVLGTTAPPFPLPQFRLGKADQSHHAVIFGRTGSGKSRLLESVFVQNLNKRTGGVGLLEPHHDLSFDTLTYLVASGFFKDERNFDRLIYLDWAAGYVPFNILNTQWDEHTTAYLALDAMLRVWPDLAEAPLFQTLFLSSLVALIANQLPITYLYQLLTDADFRARCLSKVNDPVVHQAFQWFDNLGRNQAEAAGSTLRRAFLLSFSPLARYTLGQPENWLNFRKIMDEGKSIIINLGNINDPETKRLIGAMVMVQLEQAALSRSDLAPSERTPFTLLVDEWPSFAAQEKTIGTILSQARKYNLRLWLAAQSLAQVGSERLSGAMENCKITISFALGRDSAAIQARHVGKADPFAVKEEALTITQHAQYLSVQEQFETWTQELQNLSPRMAYVKLHDSEAVKIKTLTVADPKVNPRQVKEVVEAYRTRYQRTKEEAEAAIAKLPSLQQMPSADDSSAPAYTTLFRRKAENTDSN